MSGTVVFLVNGEVLANGHGSKIVDQRSNATSLAEGLAQVFTSGVKVVITHGNKPQVGFVLFRSELASHLLHNIPLDVCGADTQGATGYMLSQAVMNAVQRRKIGRQVMGVITQTRVDASNIRGDVPMRAIGPWFDRDKAELYRQTRGWAIYEEPGRGYRRAVPCLPAVEILEIEGIKQLAEAGNIVIAGGGGGIPVIRNAQGDYEGIEAVVETEQLACIMARELKANVLFMVVETDNKFLLSGLSTESLTHLSIEELDQFIATRLTSINSRSVQSKLLAASDFLHHGGDQVVITTLRRLPETLNRQSGLWFGKRSSPIERFNIS